MNDIIFVAHASTGYRQGTVILQVGKENRTIKYHQGVVTVGDVEVHATTFGMPVTTHKAVALAEIVLAIHVATVIKDRIGSTIA